MNGEASSLISSIVKYDVIRSNGCLEVAEPSSRRPVDLSHIRRSFAECSSSFIDFCVRTACEQVSVEILPVTKHSLLDFAALSGHVP